MGGYLSTIKDADIKDDIEEDAVPLSRDNLHNKKKRSGICTNSKRELLSKREYVHKHFEYLSADLKVDVYDVMILCHDDDHNRANKCKEILCNIELQNGSKLKAVLHDDPDFNSLSRSIFGSLEEASQRCTFVFVFLSKEFVDDTWCQIVTQSFLMEMINDPNKQWSVVPVLTTKKNDCNFVIPVGLKALKELKCYHPIDDFNNHVKTLVGDKYNIRAEKEISLLSQRFLFLSQALTINIDSATTSDDIIYLRKHAVLCDEECFKEEVQKFNPNGPSRSSMVPDLDTDSEACNIQSKDCTTYQPVSGRNRKSRSSSVERRAFWNWAPSWYEMSSHRYT